MSLNQRQVVELLTDHSYIEVSLRSCLLAHGGVTRVLVAFIVDLQMGGVQFLGYFLLYPGVDGALGRG